MSFSAERKLFTAELRRQRQSAPAPETALAGAMEAMAREIAALRAVVRDLRRDAAAGPVVNVPPPPPPPPHQPENGGELGILKTELRALAFCIEQTKEEIAALSEGGGTGNLGGVTSELDAVVTATELATQQILDATEQIDGFARDLNAHVSGSFAGRLIEDIAERTTLIFEACNFQDITGQRISKVVRTLQHVDSRIQSLIDILGIAESHRMQRPRPRPMARHELHRDDSHLLNGPQRGGHGITQDEIDRLFA